MATYYSGSIEQPSTLLIFISKLLFSVQVLPRSQIHLLLSIYSSLLPPFQCSCHNLLFSSSSSLSLFFSSVIPPVFSVSHCWQKLSSSSSPLHFLPSVACCLSFLIQLLLPIANHKRAHLVPGSPLATSLVQEILKPCNQTMNIALAYIFLSPLMI